MKLPRVLVSGISFLTMLAVPLAVTQIAGCPLPGTEPNSVDGEPNDGGEPNTGGNTGNTGLTGKYIGSERCALCHNNMHADWSQTLHARALESLEAINQDKNPNCIGCHVVGYGEPGGFVDRATTNDLAGVGCEACHGPARDHAENVADATLRPKIDLSAEVCGTCHTGSHHPNYDDWLTAGHAQVTEAPAEDFELGEQLNNCGKCHSGYFFYYGILQAETVADDALAGVPREEQVAVTCAICHDPHARTGNATTPEDGRDYQLRFPEVKSPTPTNTIDATTNASRFNLCGQCHHDRGRTWQDTSRPPHHSNQANIYAGEMPMPDEEDTPLVLSRVSVHSFATEQCATCHMYRQDFQDEQAPAISGHTFDVNTLSCATSGCHPSSDQALAVKETLQAEIQARADDIVARLGDPATWEYKSEGGPEDQSTISDEIKKVRFLYYYAINDGSLGIHNPAYVRDLLITAQDILDSIGL